MYLKRYQEKVVSDISSFFDANATKKEEMTTFLTAVPKEIRDKVPVNWVENAFKECELSYNDKTKNGLDKYYPRGVVRVPTGGGKTLLAIETIKEYQTRFAKKQHGLVIWIVPSETIYSQTIKQLKDKSHYLRQIIDQASGGKTIILEKGQKLTQHDTTNNLVILFVMIQSVSRANNKEALKVFQDSGGYEGFFPQDNRYDLHQKIVQQYPNVDYMELMGNTVVKSSLGNAIRVSKPLIIIDEIHKVFTPTAKKTIDNLNPEMIIGFSATPKENMNIISIVTGLELKDEEMIKLDMHIIPPSNDDNDWKAMLLNIKEKREILEKEAIAYQRLTGNYIRPMALIQAEATGKDQRGKGKVHALDIKEYLIELGINADNIAIKSSSQNDIEDINLLSKEIGIRFIITKEALKEGWDNPFAYILGIIPNAQSSSSMTQLVGRVLRQPYVKKTGYSLLDESYVYFSKGNISDVLARVEAGLKSEGLEDIISNVSTGRGNIPELRTYKNVKIQKKFTDKKNQLYLPIWLSFDDKQTIRRFNYSRDIKEKFDFSNVNIDTDLIAKINTSLSKETTERDTYIITITDDNNVYHDKDGNTVAPEGSISYSYITRRLTEVIENPFLARLKAKELLDVLIANLGENRVAEHFSYIVFELIKIFEVEKDRQEKELFKAMLTKKELNLAITDDQVLGFKIPDEDKIEVSRLPNPYKNYLHEDLDFNSLNLLERKVGDIVDRQTSVLWWVRNKTARNWYSIQGWKKNKIRPDFIVAKKDDKDDLAMIYILESKGNHLLGSKDTIYKKELLDLITQIHKKGDLKIIKTTFSDISSHAEAYLIEENDEENSIRQLMQ